MTVRCLSPAETTAAVLRMTPPAYELTGLDVSSLLPPCCLVPGLIGPLMCHLARIWRWLFPPTSTATPPPAQTGAAYCGECRARAHVGVHVTPGSYAEIYDSGRGSAGARASAAEHMSGAKPGVVTWPEINSYQHQAGAFALNMHKAEQAEMAGLDPICQSLATAAIDAALLQSGARPRA